MHRGPGGGFDVGRQRAPGTSQERLTFDINLSFMPFIQSVQPTQNMAVLTSHGCGARGACAQRARLMNAKVTIRRHEARCRKKDPNAPQLTQTHTHVVWFLPLRILVSSRHVIHQIELRWVHQGPNTPPPQRSFFSVCEFAIILFFIIFFYPHI